MSEDTARSDRVAVAEPAPQWGQPITLKISQSEKMMWLVFRDGRELILSSESKILAVWVS